MDARSLAHRLAVIDPNIGLGKSLALALLAIAFAIDFPITITAAMSPPTIEIAALGFERRQHDNRHGLSRVPAQRPTLSRCSKHHKKACCTRG